MEYLVIDDKDVNESIVGDVSRTGMVKKEGIVLC